MTANLDLLFKNEYNFELLEYKICGTYIKIKDQSSGNAQKSIQRKYDIDEKNEFNRTNKEMKQLSMNYLHPCFPYCQNIILLIK